MSKTKRSAYDLLISREYDPSDPREATHPSRMDSLQQYRLSNFCLVTESFTFMAGTHSFPALDSWYSLERRERKVEALDLRVCPCWSQAGTHLWTPVTLSSTMPLIFLNTFGYFLYIQCVRSPPSSRIWQVTGANHWKEKQISHLRDINSTHYYHVGLPALSVDTAINAPPEIILRLPFPGKHHHAWNTTHVTSEFDIQRSVLSNNVRNNSPPTPTDLLGTTCG